MDTTKKLFGFISIVVPQKKISVLTILTYRTYFLTFSAIAFLNYSKFANKNKILPFQKLLRGWQKITHIVDGGVYLKNPKGLFDISILVLPL